MISHRPNSRWRARSWLAGGALLLLLLVPLGAELWRGPGATESRARYRLPRQEGPSLDFLIAFHRERAERDPQGGLELAEAAALSLEKARRGFDPEALAQAGDWARLSLERLPFDNLQAELVLADLDQLQHRFAACLERCHAILARRPDCWEARCLRLRAWLGLGQSAEIRAEAEALAGARPSMTSFALRGQVYEVLGDAQQALASYRAALAVEDLGQLSASVQVRCLLARLHLRCGRLDTARTLLEEALAILPSSALAADLLARVELRGGDVSRAEALWRAAWQQSLDPMFLLELAQLAAERGDARQQSVWRQTFWEHRDRAHREDLVVYHLSRAGPGDLDEALRLARESAAGRGDASSHLLLAEVLLADSQYSAAAREAEAAVRKGPLLPGTRLMAARCARAQGQRGAAGSWLEAALVLDPGHPEALALREQWQLD